MGKALKGIFIIFCFFVLINAVVIFSLHFFSPVNVYTPYLFAGFSVIVYLILPYLIEGGFYFRPAGKSLGILKLTSDGIWLVSKRKVIQWKEITGLRFILIDEKGKRWSSPNNDYINKSNGGQNVIEFYDSARDACGFQFVIDENNKNDLKNLIIRLDETGIKFYVRIDLDDFVGENEGIKSLQRRQQIRVKNLAH